MKRALTWQRMNELHRRNLFDVKKIEFLNACVLWFSQQFLVFPLWKNLTHRWPRSFSAESYRNIYSCCFSNWKIESAECNDRLFYWASFLNIYIFILFQIFKLVRFILKSTNNRNSKKINKLSFFSNFCFYY